MIIVNSKSYKWTGPNIVFDLCKNALELLLFKNKYINK